MSKLTTDKPFKYYEVTATIDGETEVMFGSYDREECLYEVEAERDHWKGQGYKKIKVGSRPVADAPDPEIYEEIAEPILEVGPLTCRLSKDLTEKTTRGKRNKNCAVWPKKVGKYTTRKQVQTFSFYRDEVEVFSLHAGSTDTARLLAHWSNFLDDYEPEVIVLRGFDK